MKSSVSLPVPIRPRSLHSRPVHGVYHPLHAGHNSGGKRTIDQSIDHDAHTYTDVSAMGGARGGREGGWAAIFLVCFQFPFSVVVL